MLNHIWKFLKSMERWEYYDPRGFWGVTLAGYFLVQSLVFGSNLLFTDSNNRNRA